MPQGGNGSTKSSQISAAPESTWSPRNDRKEDPVGISDERRAMCGGRSMPELPLVGEVARVGSRCSTSHPEVASASTLLRQSDTNNSENSDEDSDSHDGEKNTQERLGDDCREDYMTATVLRVQNSISDEDDDDAYNKKNAQRRLVRRNHVITNVLPVTAVDEQAVVQAPRSTVAGTPQDAEVHDHIRPGPHQTSNSRSSKLVTCRSDTGEVAGQRQVPSVDVNSRHEDAAADESVRRSRVFRETPSDVPSLKPVRRYTSPADINSKVRENAATAAVSEQSTAAVKRKATRVLGVMFAVFVIFWTPFFVLNLLSATCPRCVQSVDPGVWTVLVWLGWISSLANPIIYTSFSPAFRAAFKRLLTCRGRRGVSPAKHRQQLWTNQLRCRHSSLSS